MVKIKRDKRFVWPDRYYIWTYYPKKYRKSVDTVTSSRLYAKHVCCIPYFTRLHARHVACFFHGVKVLHHIHIISGKRLIEYGLSTFNMKVRAGNKKIATSIFLGNEIRHMRQWAYPPEARYDKHRRRHYIVQLNQAFSNAGKKVRRKKFNHKYKLVNYGSTYRRIQRAYMRRMYRETVYSILQEISEAESKGKG